MSDHTATLPASGADAPSVMLPAARGWRAGLIATATALAANIALLYTARGLGADMAVRRVETEAAMTIGIGTVTLMTLLPMLLATALLLPLRRWGPRAWRLLAAVGLVIAVVTVPAPFTVLAQTGTQVSLACMHLTAGIAWFLLVRRAARNTVAQTSAGPRPLPGWTCGCRGTAPPASSDHKDPAKRSTCSPRRCWTPLVRRWSPSPNPRTCC